MKHWKERINVEVLLPFDTPNCTITWYWVMFSISTDEVWLKDGIWMYNSGTYVNNAPFNINICGRVNLYGACFTCNLMSCRAFLDCEDPRNTRQEHFRVRFVSCDVELSDDERRSMKFHHRVY